MFVDTLGSNSKFTNKLPPLSLAIFDSVGFGAYIEKFLLYNADKAYFSWQSFEGFILQEVYSESTNVKAFNTEETLTKRLQELNPQYSKARACYSADCYKCDKSCTVNANQVFSNSKYGLFLDYEKVSRDVLVEALLKQWDKSLEYKENILSYLPKSDIAVSTLRTLVEDIIRSL